MVVAVAKTNKFRAVCYCCGKTVPAGGGYPERYKGTWRIGHIRCVEERRHADIKKERENAGITDE